MFKENFIGEKFLCDILHSYICPISYIQILSVHELSYKNPLTNILSYIFLASIVTVARQIFIQRIWSRKCLLSLSKRVSVVLPSVYQCCPTQRSLLLINISSRRCQVFSKCSFKLQDQSNQYEYVEYYDKIILLYLVCTVSLVQILRFCISLALEPHHTIFRKPDSELHNLYISLTL